MDKSMIHKKLKELDKKAKQEGYPSLEEIRQGLIKQLYGVDEK